MNALSFVNPKKLVILTGFLLFYLIFVRSSFAATLGSASATLTTSRPSASSPINDGGSPPGTAANSGQITIFNNGSRYLASDSAKIIRNQGGTITNNDLNIASQSGDLTEVYLTGVTGQFAAASADVLFVPITAMHKISFTTITSIPIGGRIIITYPGASNTTASPSATTFAFNDLTTANAAANISYKLSTGGTSTCTFTVAAPTITCLTAVAVIPGGSVITFLIGCGDSGTNTANCTTQKPRLINPTKSSQTAGAADTWRIGITTQDNSATPVNLDDARVAIATVETVTVRATIDPSLTFTIAGVGNAVALNSGIGATINGCSQLDTTNTGIGATATEVSLGSLSLPPATTTRLSNISAQTLIVATNGGNGYSITATSSGALRNPTTGFFLNSALVPQRFPALTHFFGLHACGVDTDLTKWTSTSVSACNTYITGSSDPICLYGWPTATTPVLIAQKSTGPVGIGSACNSTGCGQNIVSYAATQDVTIPPGNYQTTVTYVATPSF